jgi:magnesium chelatase subunit I
VLEERDVQIRGFPVRLNLDLCMVFSANPEDYTNRGRIVTPLKDRIGSVVRTHYPLTRELGIAINDQNAWLERTGSQLAVPIYIKEIVEEASRLARSSPHVNQQSGVSVRMSIANLENVISNAERRALVNAERWVVPRVSDVAHIVPSARGKIELTMTEDDGHEDKLIGRLADEAVKAIFTIHVDAREFRQVVDYFESGKSVELGDMLSSRVVLERIEKVPGLRKRADELARALLPDLEKPDAREAATASAAEFILEGLYVHNKLNKNVKAGTISYRR